MWWAGQAGRFGEEAFDASGVVDFGVGLGFVIWIELDEEVVGKERAVFLSDGVVVMAVCFRAKEGASEEEGAECMEILVV